jgi:hypothetical protein
MNRELRSTRRCQSRGTISHDPVPLRSATTQGQALALSPCEHRNVAKDGRIVCRKIVEGDGEVSPNVCRACPFKAVNCGHLCFSLCQTSPSPLIVRFNGRTEVWDDGPPELRFERAACEARVMPIHDPRSCAGCSLRQPLHAPVEPVVTRRPAAGVGKVVSFPSREALAATG